MDDRNISEGFFKHIWNVEYYQKINHYKQNYKENLEKKPCVCVCVCVCVWGGGGDRAVIAF